MSEHKAKSLTIPTIMSVLFAFSVVPCLWGAHLQHVSTVGSEAENYIFYRISGAVLAPNRDVYVLDFKGHSIARYDRKGTFIKRIGKRGQGPGEFNMPRFLDILGNKLYLMDGGNARIAEISLNLDQVDYQRLSDGMPFLNSFFALEENRFIGGSFGLGQKNEFNGIKIADLNSGHFTLFFGHTPGDKYKKVDTSSRRNLMRSFLFVPRFGMDPTRKKILATFFQPDNPVMFFLYSVEGQCLDNFSYSIEKKYRFPSYFLEVPVRYPPISHVPLVGAVFWHNQRYIVFLALVEYRRKYPDKKNKYCLIFDEKSRKLSAQFEVADDLEPFFLSPGGYLLATRSEESIPRLYIYKFHF